MNKDANRQKDIIRHIEIFRHKNVDKFNLWTAIAGGHKIRLIMLQNRMNSNDSHFKSLGKLIKNYEAILK